MGLFDFISDTKDRMDKSRQAREYIQRAKELVNEGNEIYNKAYNKVSGYAAETEYLLSKHNDYKKSISKELGDSIGVTLKDFTSFNIDAKVIPAPIIRNLNSNINSLTVPSIRSFNSMLQNSVIGINLLSLSDFFISDSDYYEAKYKRDEARLYKERMKREREVLFNYKEKMSEIRSFISSEKNELDSLMTKLRKMNDDLKTAMRKKTFTNDEAEYLKGIHKIAECISTLLSTEFLGDSFSISQKYTNVFNEIKRINQNLPAAPSISDSNTIIRIKQILDGRVIH